MPLQSRQQTLPQQAQQLNERQQSNEQQQFNVQKQDEQQRPNEQHQLVEQQQQQHETELNPVQVEPELRQADQDGQAEQRQGRQQPGNRKGRLTKEQAAAAKLAREAEFAAKRAANPPARILTRNRSQTVSTTDRTIATVYKNGGGCGIQYQPKVLAPLFSRI
jgi:hypothetical protein